jgi:hypothetical protein
MNLPMTPNALSIPISVSTAIDVSAVPIHKRRVRGPAQADPGERPPEDALGQEPGLIEDRPVV